MTIEGLGKKFQEARLARNLTLDEAARMTKIRPARLAEIEADDFSQFPSLAYAKGFLLIYGKFLDVDVTPYLDAFEDSERVTVDGYSYLQENRPQKPVTAPVIRRRRPADNQPRTHLTNAAHLRRARVGDRLLRNEVDPQRAAACARTSGVHGTGVTECVSGSKSQGRTTGDDRGVAGRCCVCADSRSIGFGCSDSCAKSCCSSSAGQSEPEVRKAKPVRPGGPGASAAADEFILRGIRRAESRRYSTA